MKKVLGSVVLVLVYSLFVPAYAVEVTPVVTSENTMQPVYFESSWCDFSSKELAEVSLMYDLFDAKAEEKIIQRHFDDGDYQGLVRGLTDEFMQITQQIVDVCVSGDIDAYTRDMPLDIQSVIDMLQEYAIAVLSLKQFVAAKPANDIVQDQVAVLQEHLLGDMQNLFLENVFIHELTNLDISFIMDNSDVSIDFDLAVDAEGTSDLRGTTSDGSAHVIAHLSLEDANRNGSTIDLEMDMQMLIADGGLYIKLENVSTTIIESIESAEVQEQIDQIVNALKLVEGKRLDILDQHAYNNNLLDEQVFFNLHEAAISLLGTAWFTTYAKEGDIYYAGLNPLTCTALQGWMSTQDCLGVWMDQYQTSKGKGLLVFSEYYDSVGLRLNEDLVDDFMGVSAGEDLLVWNDDEIVLLDLDFGDIGVVIYENSNLDIDLNFPQEVYDRETDSWSTDFLRFKLYGTKSNNAFDLKGTITDSETYVNIDLTRDGPWDDFVMDVRVDIEDFSAQAFTVVLEMTLDDEWEEVDAISVEAPDQSDVVDMSVFEVF